MADNGKPLKQAIIFLFFLFDFPWKKNLFCAAAFCNHLLIELKRHSEETEYKIDRFETKPGVSLVGFISILCFLGMIIATTSHPPLQRRPWVHKSRISVTHPRLVCRDVGSWVVCLKQTFQPVQRFTCSTVSIRFPQPGAFCCGRLLEAARPDTDAVRLCRSGLHEPFPGNNAKTNGYINVSETVKYIMRIVRICCGKQVLQVLV